MWYLELSEKFVQFEIQIYNLSMRVLFLGNLLKQFPHHLVAFGVINNVSVISRNDATEKILTDIYPEVIKKYKSKTLSLLNNSQAYENLAKELGDHRFGFPYMQIRRVLSEKQIGNINNIVNQYMVYELLSNLSFSAYDLDMIEGEIHVELANQGETITLIGGEEKEVPNGDIVFRDTKGIFYSFSIGYADRTKVATNTKNVLFTIDAPKGIDGKEVEENIKKLCGEFNSNKYYIVNGSTPSIEIN